jgi:hypothetical protein
VRDGQTGLLVDENDAGPARALETPRTPRGAARRRGGQARRPKVQARREHRGLARNLACRANAFHAPLAADARHASAIGASRGC